MRTRTATLVPLALVIAALVPTAAPAVIHDPQSDAAMRKGIRDFAKHGLKDGTARATNVKVDCVQAAKVGSTKPCNGTFSLTRGGRIAHYTLRDSARTFRVSPGAMQYSLNATATRKAAGLPGKITLWAGFLQ